MFEYQVLRVPNRVLEKTLNDYGAEAWEVVGVTKCDMVVDTVNVILKRNKCW